MFSYNIFQASSSPTVVAKCKFGRSCLSVIIYSVVNRKYELVLSIVIPNLSAATVFAPVQVIQEHKETNKNSKSTGNLLKKQSNDRREKIVSTHPLSIPLTPIFSPMSPTISPGYVSRVAWSLMGTTNPWRPWFVPSGVIS